MTDEICGYEGTDGDRSCQNPATEGDSCWIEAHGGDVSGHGRPSKFADHRDELLEAAGEPIKTREVARTAGVGKSTLYDWLDEYDDFSDAFKRARSQAARDLVRRGLEDPDVDTSMIRFLLERTFDYVKTEKREVDATHEHSGQIDGEHSLDDGTRAAIREALAARRDTGT